MFVILFFVVGCSEDNSPTDIDTPEHELSNIVINEINYNSIDDFDPGDWVELYNIGEDSVDLSRWVFSDELDSHTYLFPNNTVLDSNEYLVLCGDVTAFLKIFPAVNNFIGSFYFGLSGKGELIRLFDADGNLIDSVQYSDDLPWPEEADGEGSTLSLINPTYNNIYPHSWKASLGHGTPGIINDVYKEE